MNSILPTLFQFLFLLVVVIAFVAAVKFFRHSLAPKIAKDWQSIALLGILSLMALFSTMAYLRFVAPGNGVEAQKVQQGEVLTVKLDENEHAYLMAVYMPLEKSYKQLQLNIEAIDKFKVKIYQLNNTYPNHAKLLSKVLAHFNQEGAEQRKLFNRVNREIRYAMIQSSTQDVAYIDKRFSERAKILNADIEKRQKKMDLVIKKTASHMEKSLNEARKILIRGRPKVRGQITEYNFSGETEAKLLAFLNTKDIDVYSRVGSINQEILNAERKKERMRNLSMQHKDLASPLMKTMSLWQKSEESARQHWNDLLYAVEALYLADQINTPDHNPSYRSLFSTLKKQSERKLVRIQNRRIDVEKSFVSPEYVNKTQ